MTMTDTQLTPEEAIALHDSGVWKQWSARERALFQLHQECLAMPFSDFQEAVEHLLGRPVFTHELASPGQLIREFAGLEQNP